MPILGRTSIHSSRFVYICTHLNDRNNSTYYITQTKLTFDSQGDVFVLETYQDSFIGITPNATRILTKFDTNGNQVYNKIILADVSNAFIMSLAADATGNLYITYVSNLMTNFGQPIASTLIKYNLNGAQDWNKTWNAFSHPIIMALAADRAGYIYAMGLALGNGTTQIETLITVWDGSGSTIWNETLDNVIGTGITISHSGYILINGYSFDQSAQNSKGTKGLNFITFNKYFTKQILILSSIPLITQPLDTNNGNIFLVLITTLFSEGGILGIVFLLFVVIGIGSVLLYSKKQKMGYQALKELTTNRKVNNKQQNINTEHRIGLTNFNTKDSLDIIEQTMAETYHAPDYATALKIKEGGFPDYETYKKATDKGIQSYSEWIKDKKVN